MPVVEFDALPDAARLWIFPTSREVTDVERERILSEADRFLEDWRAHGAPLTCGRTWAHDRFLLVAVDERPAAASGCSIDALVRSLRALESELDLRLMDRAPYYLGIDGLVRTVSRPSFSERAAAGEVGPDTVLFDLSLSTMSAYREGAFARPIRGSWLESALPRSVMEG